MQLRPFSGVPWSSGCQIPESPSSRHSCIKFHKTLAINPASLLPDNNPEEPVHDCLEVTDIIQTARPVLTNVPLP